MRWIALHLPLLSLETFAATLPDADRSLALSGAGLPLGLADAGRPFAPSGAGRPLALADAQRIVTAADAAAQALGVKPGLKRATALALAPQLVIGQADAARDTEALVAVAHAALAFTPMVALQPAADRDAAPDTVLLEVQSTLRYHGGLDALLARLRVALAPLHHRIQCVDAPVAQGAALLARVHRRLQCTDRTALHRALDAAAVWLLGPGREHWDALQGMGLRTLADLRRLPRAGLARRFGEGLLDEFDRAYGHRPDPRVAIVLPQRFASRLELFARADTTEQVLHGAGVLLARLVAWLSAQHAYARRFVLVMRHEPRWRSDASTPAATELAVALAEPSRDAAHLQLLLRERLATLQLPAPTIELDLSSDDIVQRAPPSGELFPTPANEREGLVRLIERLQARLGTGQVQRLEMVADHRPERSTAQHPAQALAAVPRPVAAAAAKPAAPVRPVWLIAPPEPLPERQARPFLDGQALQLLSGPERIETGWWDGELAERDYFIAMTGGGALVWIYRTRLPREGAGWFLQGRFA